MNVLICDDDKAAALQIESMLKSYCASIGRSVNLHTFTQPAQIGHMELFDIAFLDIDMKDVNGVDLARQLRAVRPDAILIFVTNFIQYAPEGYEVQAFRYLLKADINLKLFHYFDLAVEEVIKKRQVVTISINAETIDIPIENILYLESNRRIIIMHLINYSRSSYQFYGNMSNLENKFGVLGFLRIQKSYLVNMQYIEIFQYGKVQLKTGVLLTASEKNHTELKKRYLQWKGKNKWSIC